MFPPELVSFLSNPVVEVRLSDSDKMEELAAKNQRLEEECNRARALYRSEVELNLRLVDLLRAHGIRWRDRD